MKKSKNLREYLKKTYKRKRKEDAKTVGVKINDLVQSLHLQQRLPEKERNFDVISSALKILSDIRSEHRFKDDFPSFAKFYAFIVDPENKFTNEDLKDL